MQKSSQSQTSRHGRKEAGRGAQTPGLDGKTTTKQVSTTQRRQTAQGTCKGHILSHQLSKRAKSQLMRVSGGFAPVQELWVQKRGDS